MFYNRASDRNPKMNKAWPLYHQAGPRGEKLRKNA